MTTTPLTLEDAMEEPSKYIVLKREDIARIKSPEVRRWVNQHSIQDAVVIRRQDMFAPPALHAYANSIGMAAKVTDNAEMAGRLQAVADYFAGQAVLAEAEAFKLPGD